MENLGNSHFDEEWKKALAAAELAPKASVWQSVELSLVQAENLSMKKQVVLYQRLAAASVVVLFMVAGYFFFLSEGTDTDSLPMQSNNLPKAEQTVTNPLNDSSINEITKSINSIEGSIASTKTENQAAVITKKTSLAGGLSSANTSATKLDQTITNSKSSISIDSAFTPFGLSKRFAWGRGATVPSKLRPMSDAVSLASIALVPIDKLPKIIHPTGYSLAYRLADVVPFAGKSKKQPFRVENTWTSVGFAAGSFVPNATGTDFNQANAPSNLAGSYTRQNSGLSDNQNPSPGRSMAVMLAAGKRIFKKWVIQGGLSYMNQTSSSNSAIVTVAPANQLADFAVKNAIGPETTGTVTFSTPTVLNSSSQFISVPLQAGYMLVDKRFGIQINGGLSPDFFLRNTVFDETSQQEVGNAATGGSTFKALSFSGLGSVEMSYGFYKHYRVSLLPGLRYSITSPYQQNLLTSGKPFAADIALRFRYIFN